MLPLAWLAVNFLCAVLPRYALHSSQALNDAERPKFHELWTVSKSDKQLMAKDTLSAWEILKLVGFSHVQHCMAQHTVLDFRTSHTKLSLRLG